MVASIAPMPKDKKSTDKKKQKDERSPEQRESDTAAKKAAKEARKAEKAAAKAAEEAARAADKSAKREAKKAAKAGGAPSFKHVRKKKLASGKGPTPQEIGESLVALFNAGKSDEAESTWYHRKIESIEDDGSVFKGWKGVQEKGKWWRNLRNPMSVRLPLIDPDRFLQRTEAAYRWMFGAWGLLLWLALVLAAGVAAADAMRGDPGSSLGWHLERAATENSRRTRRLFFGRSLVDGGTI